jgi:cytochrome c oxidase subunit 3
MAGGSYILPLGFIVLFVMFAGWFNTVAHESEGGCYQASGHVFRWGMSWFIFRRMFFAAFFGALGYIRLYRYRI